MTKKSIARPTTSNKPTPVIVAYVPVLHKGYQEFFNKHPKAKDLYLIGFDLAHELRPLQKDVRALEPKDAMTALIGWSRFDNISVLNNHNIKKLLNKLTSSGQKIIMPNEEIGRLLTKKYFGKNKVVFDDIFLMWDKKSTQKKNDVKADLEISSNKIDQKMMKLAEAETASSADWWRHVGAVIVKDKKIILKTHNTHTPNEQQPYFDGDPRANFSKGKNIELSTAIHAEAKLIAEAAKQGLSLEGSDLYVTTFPCPVCAKQVAHSGIKRLFFKDGYSVLDGEKILRDKGVEIVRVKG